MNELRKKLRDLEIKHTSLLAAGKEEEAHNVWAAMCEVKNLMEKQADALNAQVPMMIARGFGMN